MINPATQYQNALKRLLEYYTDEEAREWLHVAHPQLDGKKPIDLIKVDQSQMVHAVLDRLDADGYL